MIRALVRAVLFVLPLVGFVAAPAYAGNIALTGHDDDYHCSHYVAFTGPGCVQLNAIVTFARSGSTTSTLPVLTFDSGTQLTSSLTSLGILFTNIDPNTSSNVTDALFDPLIYSAFVVASDESCGGCDNTVAGEANIVAHSSAIASFFNAGGGIVGLAAAESPHYYDFLPESASTHIGAPAFGYVQQPCGVTYGVDAVNGDQTHNHFSEPGTGGVSALYCVAERNENNLPHGANAMTLLLKGGQILTSVITTTSGTTTSTTTTTGTTTTGTTTTGTTTTGTTTTGTTTSGDAVPEPASLALLGLGLAAAYVRHRASML